jgi:transcriptional regulator with XRE-family HTH domain
MLEGLTLRQDLKALTVLPWGTAISQFGLLRGTKAWCPSCFEKARQNSAIIYEPLLWAFNVVTICPSHRCVLEQICPCCKRQLPLISGYSRPGYCSWCQTWLGGGDQLLKTHDQEWLDFQLSVSQSVREWIGVAVRLPSPPSGENSTLRIRECINRLADGNATGFAKIVNVTPGAAVAWRTGEFPPSLADLMRICHVLEVSLTELLTAETLEETFRNKEGVVRQMQGALRIRFKNRNAIRHALEAALKEDPPPSIHEFAARFNYKSVCPLYIHFPKFSRKLTQRWRAARRPRTRPHHYTEAEKESMRVALESALKEYPTPSLEQIAKRLGFPAYTLRRRFPDLCCQIKTKREKEKQTLFKDIELRLEKVAEEIPPPPPSEVTKRFSYKRFDYLASNFPKLCGNIMDRYYSWKDDEVQRVLREALVENPPPSLEEVTRRNSYNTKTLRTNHRELCRAITSGRKKYLRKRTLKRRRMFKEEVRKIAIELLNSGQYPSRRRIAPLLVDHSFSELTVVLRELRQEIGLQYG